MAEQIRYYMLDGEKITFLLIGTNTAFNTAKGKLPSSTDYRAYTRANIDGYKAVFFIPEGDELTNEEVYWKREEDDWVMSTELPEHPVEVKMDDGTWIFNCPAT